MPRVRKATGHEKTRTIVSDSSGGDGLELELNERERKRVSSGEKGLDRKRRRRAAVEEVVRGVNGL